MFRILFVLSFVALTFKSDAQNAKVHCVLQGIEPDKYGCVYLEEYEYMLQQNCINLPPCFKIEYSEVKGKEYFANIKSEDKRNIISTLDSSAAALIKNGKLKNIKIIFYNKNNKLDKQFINDAERYLLEKGVEKKQFKIEIRE